MDNGTPCSTPEPQCLLHAHLGHAGPRLAHLQPLYYRCSNPPTGPLPQKIFTFPKEAKGLNGLCSLSESRLIAADSFGSCIWAIDVDTSSFPPKTTAAKKWLAHDTMYGALKLPDFQPGVNGLKYHARTSHAYYTSTQKRVFCRVSVDRRTLEPAGEPEILAEGMPGDDLIIDDTSVNDQWRTRGT